MNIHNKLESHITKGQEMLAWNKCSSLLGPFVSYERKVLWERHQSAKERDKRVEKRDGRDERDDDRRDVKNQRRALRRAARRGVEKVRRVAAAAFQPDLFVAQPGFLLFRIEQLGADQGRGGRHETAWPVLRQLPERHLTERLLFSAQEVGFLWPAPRLLGHQHSAKIRSV